MNETVPSIHASILFIQLFFFFWHTTIGVGLIESVQLCEYEWAWHSAARKENSN